jgi:hypothetical protein
VTDEAASLADAAFGSAPGRWPLPTPITPLQTWQRAVAAAGQGRYAGAVADLDVLERMVIAGPLRSLGCSTRASFLRQLGGHSAARALDGRAWATADADPDARADALIGLAADALGIGRFALSARLLHRADGDVAAASARIPVRLAWVSAELAMATGDGDAAAGHAERAVALADTVGSVRHAVKSQVVLAAARCCQGRIEAARTVADTALAAARDHGLLPLSWALACLLGDVGSVAHAPADIVAIRDAAAASVAARGGVWSVR